MAAHKGIPVGTVDIDLVVYAQSRFKLAELLNELASLGVPVDPALALRELDEKKLTALPMPVATPEGQATFVVELILPKIPVLDAAVLSRAIAVPYPGRAEGIPVVTLPDWMVFKLIFFREKDRRAVDDVLRTTPDLDVGYVAICLGMVFPPEDERLRWFANALARYGFET